MKSPVEEQVRDPSGGIAKKFGHRRLGHVQPGRRDQREALQTLG